MESFDLVIDFFWVLFRYAFNSCLIESYSYLKILFHCVLKRLLRSHLPQQRSAYNSPCKTSLNYHTTAFWTFCSDNKFYNCRELYLIRAAWTRPMFDIAKLFSLAVIIFFLFFSSVFATKNAIWAFSLQKTAFNFELGYFLLKKTQSKLLSVNSAIYAAAESVTLSWHVRVTFRETSDECFSTQNHIL